MYSRAATWPSSSSLVARTWSGTSSCATASRAPSSTLSSAGSRRSAPPPAPTPSTPSFPAATPCRAAVRGDLEVISCPFASRAARSRLRAHLSPASPFTFCSAASSRSTCGRSRGARPLCCSRRALSCASVRPPALDSRIAPRRRLPGSGRRHSGLDVLLGSRRVWGKKLERGGERHARCAAQRVDERGGFVR